MAVNSTHPDYDASAVDWSRARDVLAGEDAVKAAGERFLPRLVSQSDENGVGGDDCADCLRYLVATKSRTITQRKLRGL